MGTKTCTECGVTKGLSEFYVRRTASNWPLGGRRPIRPVPNPACKECAKARVMAARAIRRADEDRNRNWMDIQNEKKKAKSQRVKDAVFGAYGGYRCVCCGEVERLFLSIDHIHNDGAAWRRATFGHRQRAGAYTYRWLVKHHFPAGFQVLCMNCNHGKRMNQGVCPHQGRRNDYPLVGVGPSGPKRIASSQLRLVMDDEIVSPAMKIAAAQ